MYKEDMVLNNQETKPIFNDILIFVNDLIPNNFL